MDSSRGVDEAVAIHPGATALQVIPRGARSTAMDLVNPTMATFDAWYAASSG